MATFLHKFFTACLSVITFSFLIAAFQVFFLHNELEFGLLVTIYSFYMTPVFIIFGIPISYIIDKVNHINIKDMIPNFSSFLRLLVPYSIAGIAVAMIYGSMTAMNHGLYVFSMSDSLLYIIAGLAGALVFHSIAFLLLVEIADMKKAQEEIQEEEELKRVKEMY